MTNENKLKLGTIRYPLLMFCATNVLALIGFPTDIKMNLINALMFFIGFAASKIMAEPLKRSGINKKLLVVLITQLIVYYAIAAYIWTHGENRSAFMIVGGINLLLCAGWGIYLATIGHVMSKTEEDEFERRRREIFMLDDEEEEPKEKKLRARRRRR